MVIIICIIGYLVYQINSYKTGEEKKVSEIQNEVNTINENKTKDTSEITNNNETKTNAQQSQAGTAVEDSSKALSEIKKCLKDENWLKQNIYITQDEMISDDSDILDQQIKFIVCKSNTNPIVVVETLSENALISKIDLITYDNKVKVERIDQGHIYHGGFDIDANKCVVRSGFMHMGTCATSLKSVADGKVKFMGSYMYEEDSNNSTVDNIKYKYYIKEKNSEENREVSENEYNEYKESLNENQYNFVDINTELTAENIDKYL